MHESHLIVRHTPTYSLKHKNTIHASPQRPDFDVISKFSGEYQDLIYKRNITIRVSTENLYF